MGMGSWVSLWVRPRKTIRAIIDTHPTRVILWLAVLSGVLSALSWTALFWTQYPGIETLHHPLFITGIVVIGALFGLFQLYFGGWLLKVVGSWLGGTGDFTALKCALGWSYYPGMVGVALNLLSYGFLNTPWVYFVVSLIAAAVIVWALILLFFLVAEAHQFSFWKGLVTLLITFVLVFVGVMLLSLLVPLLHPLFMA